MVAHGKAAGKSFVDRRIQFGAMTSPLRDHAFSARWSVAFSLLILAVHELHELVHVVTGRLLCGTWAERDFNAWWFVRDCPTVMPTVAGPVFSYVVMLAGAALASSAKSAWRWTGVALVFSANPFARIFTAVMGGGDEMVVGRHIAGGADRTWTVRVAVIVVVATICGTAIAVAWRAMRDLKRRALWFAALLLWPMVLTGVLLFVVGNRLLRAGVLVEPAVGGAPLLVVLVTVAVFVLTGLTIRWLPHAVVNGAPASSVR